MKWASSKSFVARIDQDRRPRARVRPEFLAQAFGVVADQGVGGVENPAGRAVVLFEPYDTDVGEVLLEVVDVLDLRAPPAVDGLVVVADGPNRARSRRTAGFRGGEPPQPSVLDAVRVLEFVDEEVAEAASVVGAEIRIVAQQLVAAQQEFGEIHQSAPVAELLVDLVDLPVEGGEHIVVRRRHVLGAPAFVLVRIDEPDRLARRPLLFVEVEAAHHPLHQPKLVVGIENLEILGRAASRECMRNRRWAMPWNVPTHMARPGPSSRRSTRPRISAAALLVNVTARMPPGDAPRPPPATRSDAPAPESCRFRHPPPPADCPPAPSPPRVGGRSGPREYGLRPTRVKTAAG